ncbi:MAG: hypothetical protein ABI579_06825, partial [Candidatus Sumerlaeota bacterium]
MTALAKLPKAALLLLAATLCWNSASAIAPASTAVRPMTAMAAAPEIGILPMGAQGAQYEAQPGQILACGNATAQMVLVKPTYVVGEPVFLRLVIRKRDKAQPSVEFRSRLAFGTDIHAYIIPDKGRPYEYLGNQLGSTVPTGVITLDRFSTFRIDYRLAMDKNTVSGVPFEDPGVYVIKVTQSCGDGDNAEPVALGDFTITVKAAEGDDAKALEFLNDYRLFECFQTRSARYALGTRRLDAQQVALFQRVVDQAPKAALRPYAMQVIAEYFVDQDNRPKSIETYAKVIDEYPGSIVAEEATLRIISLLQLEGRDDEARQYFLSAWQSPTMSQLVLPGTPNWTKYVQPYQYVASAKQWSL